MSVKWLHFPVCDSEKAILLEANVTVTGSHDGWVDINVTAAAAQWNYYPATNQGLYVVVKNHFG